MVEGMAIQVFTGDDGPVVVKTATTPSSRSALAREVARLQRARHPGVVELLSSTTDRLEVAWVGAHTLETASLPVPAAAAVLAAVAETVADLHAMGIVHGRLDPSHVLLTGDGRPVVCGMVGPDPADASTGPAEDVDAIGRLMDHLLGPDAEPEPIPERRWSRKTWSGYHRRALQTLADRASHEDPARRPTARALANAIVEAVPDARLQPSPRADLPPRPTELSIADQVTADDPPSVDPDEIDGPAEPGTGSDREAGFDAEVDAMLARGEAFETAAAARLTETFLGLRVEAADGGGPVGSTDRPATTASITAGPGLRPRPPSGRTAVMGAAAAVLVVALGAGSVLDRRGDEVEAVTAPPVTSPPSTMSASTAPPPTAPNTTSSAIAPSAPIEAGATIVEAGTTYAIGEPGDVVEVADWDCDGEATPGVVRPVTGEVFLFDRWATPGEPVTSAPSLTIQGATSLLPPEPDELCRPTLVVDDGRLLQLAGRPAGPNTAWVIADDGDDVLEAER